MKKLLWCLFVFISITLASSGQIINKDPLSPRVTGYKIDANLDTFNKKVNCKMEAFWVNATNETIPDIQLHLYMNAYRNNKTTVYKEMHGGPGKDSTAYGWIDILSFTEKNGTDLVPNMHFISPDDGNVQDKTVLQVILPKAAAPGDTVFISVHFETKLPSNIRRTGYNDDFYFVGQWFPKFGVYEPSGMRYRSVGGWNCHQFHANSEFYANYSVYDVNITVPKEYVVGTGGMLISESDADTTGKNKTLKYRAEDIVDFAWTAWPGYVVFKDQWEHVSLTLLIPHDRTDQVERQFTAVKNALEYFSKNVGPFPWSHLTFVDPPEKGSGAGGMEYTTLFTSTSSYIMPAFFHVPEMVTVHEFGHAYFMGILATNEFEDPWMDEGINSFWEERIVDHYWGENSGMIDLPFFKIPDKAMSRLPYVRSENRQVVSNIEYSWNYPHGTYGMMSYLKTATWLYTLMGIVGEETTNDIFREYYKQWAFKHPAAKDFIAVVNEVVKKDCGEKFGPDMNWFFDQTLYGTGICDYKVAGFHNWKRELSTGKFDAGDTLGTHLTLSDSLYTAIVALERIGEVMLPVDVLIHFTNGEEVHENWDGKSRYKDFKYEGSRKIDWVKIDPDYKIRMDVNFVNNSMTSRPDRVPVRRFTDKIISVMQLFICALTL
jgi:hypothetical protein